MRVYVYARLRAAEPTCASDRDEPEGKRERQSGNENGGENYRVKPREILCSAKSEESVGHSGGTRGKGSARDGARLLKKDSFSLSLPPSTSPFSPRSRRRRASRRGVACRTDRKSFTAASAAARAFAGNPSRCDGYDFGLVYGFLALPPFSPFFTRAPGKTPATVRVRFGDR